MIISALDIETIPDQLLPEDAKPAFNPDDVKLGNVKDPAKIEAKIEEARQSFETDLIKKMSIDPSLAQICTFVGIRWDIEKQEEISRTSLQITKSYDGDDLDAVIGGWDFILKSYQERIPLVTFNGTAFDLPVMWHRAITQDVTIDRVMYSRLTPRYGGPFHYDLLGLLAGWTLDKMKGHTLDFFLRRYKIGEKGGMDGSMVWPAWELGEYDKIQKYCESDVINTCKLFQRVAPWVWIKKEEDK